MKKIFTCLALVISLMLTMCFTLGEPVEAKTYKKLPANGWYLVSFKTAKIKTGKLKIDITTPQEKLADQVKDQIGTDADEPKQDKAAAESVPDSAPEPVKKPETPAAFVSKGRAFSVDKSSFGNADVRISKAESGSEMDQTDVNEVRSSAEAVPAVDNAQPEHEADENNQLPAAVKTEENKASAEFSESEDVLSEAENDDFSVIDPDEVSDDESAVGDEYETDAEEDLPFVSEDLVRRMSVFVNSPEFLRFQLPEYEYALPP